MTSVSFNVKDDDKTETEQCLNDFINKNDLLMIENIPINDILYESTNNTEQITGFSSQKYCYHFDFPLLKESGYVEIFPNKITILFPDKHNENNKDSYVCSKDINLFINKQIKFSYQWLPIHTLHDFLRIKDMLNKGYFEFLKLLQWSDNEYWYKENPQLYNELITTKCGLLYNINCFENNFNTSVQLDIEKKTQNQKSNPIYLPFNLQIYIGTNMVFCLERDLKDLKIEDIYAVLIFIMQKIK